MKRLLACLFLAITAAPLGAGDAPLARIAFGSCVHQDKPQPIWDTIVAARPDLFLMIGDNLYHDVIVDKAAGKEEPLAAKYAKIAKQPGFMKLKQLCPVLATWDDHDYGKNDAGAEYPFKKDAQKALLDFLETPADSPRRLQEGVYHARIFGPPDKSLQVILLDTRYFRGPLKKRKAPPGDGPYDPNPDTTATMLGEAQWKWLEEQLRLPAKVRLLCSSIQVVAQDHHHEKWHNLPHERERLFKLLADTKASGVVCLSGDRHLAELSMMDAGIGYPLYDLTSSGLTQATLKWRKHEVNRHRVATMNVGNNFGMIHIDWSAADPVIRLQIRDVAGEVTIQEKLPLGVLQPGTIKSSKIARSGAVRINGQPLTPELVKMLLNQEVNLEMAVQAAGMSATGGLVFLNSEADRRSPDNFTVVLDKKAQATLAAAGIAEPRKHFDGKMIRVTGVLSMFREQPQIVVSDAKQITAAE